MKRLMLSSVALVALGAAPASAALQIAVDVDGVTDFCRDNTACDNNPAIGQLGVSGVTLNGVTVSGSLSQSLGAPGSPSLVDFLNTSSLQVSNNAGATRSITVTVSDTSFHAPAVEIADAGSGTWERAIGSSITLRWFADHANGQGADNAFDTPGTLLDTFSDVSTRATNDAFSTNGVNPFLAGSPFSMTEQASFTLVKGGELVNRGQSMAAAIPETRTWVMFSLGLGLMGFLGYKRKGDRLTSVA